MANILIIDDDDMILRVVSRILSLDHHNVTTANRFSDDLMRQLVSFDMILLDIMMPEINGFDIIRLIRDETSAPIIFLTSKTQEEEVVYGLGLGADDYVKKPFSPEELKARIQSHLRREKRTTKSFMSKGIYRFDLKGKRLFCQSEEINLTKGEYLICEYLAKYSGQVFTKEQIFEEVFGFDKGSNENTIVTHIKNIRAKLSKKEAVPIETVWGIGYRWKD